MKTAYGALYLSKATQQNLSTIKNLRLTAALRDSLLPVSTKQSRPATSYSRGRSALSLQGQRSGSYPSY